MSNVSRESFAYEADWLAYLRHEAQRAKAQKLAEFRANNKTLDARVLAPRVHALIQKMRKRERDQQWYQRDKAAHPERYEHRYKRSYWRDPERHQAYTRKWRVANLEHYRLQNALYSREHRAAQVARARRRYHEDPEFHARRLEQQARAKNKMLARMTPEQREAYRAKGREYARKSRHKKREENPEEYRLRQQQYDRTKRERHGDEINARNRMRYETDPAYRERRLAAKRSRQQREEGAA